jgi:RND family efflux transporter MFP subunit
VAAESAAQRATNPRMDELRIDRSGDSAPSRRTIWWALFAAAIVAATASSWYLFRPSAILISTAVVEQADTDDSRQALPESVLDASGYVVARRRATVSSKVTGKVADVLLEEGQHVDAGQIIARLDDSNVRAALAQSNAQFHQAEANLNSAQTAFDDARPIFERSEKQKKAAVISAQSFDEARAQFDASHNSLLIAEFAVDEARAALSIAQRNLDDTIIRAPFSGIVTEKNAQPGEMVSPVSAGGGFTRTGIGTLVDMDSLEVEVDVSESFINRIRTQQPVVIKLNAYPDWQIAGSVIAIIPTADRAKATVKVRINIGQKDPRIIPEMGVRVAFLRALMPTGSTIHSPGAVVPSEAIGNSPAGSTVYVLRGTIVQRRLVTLGPKTSHGQVVLAGLDIGSTVAVESLDRLSDGVQVQVR